ncbi:TetR/AcrR family transcriptional regulator [Microbacterium lacticum]
MAARSGGRPTAITAEAIAQAVIDVGFDKATTTTVARRLGIAQSSLYRHIDSKNALIIGAINRVLSAGDFDPDAANWREYLTRLATALWETLRSHPGLSQRLYELDTIPGQSQRIMFNGVTRLVGFGWSVPDAVLVLDSIADMTGDAINQIERTRDEGRDSLADHIATELDQTTGIEREVRDYLADALRADPRAWWQRKLDLLLTGAEQLLTQVDQ